MKRIFLLTALLGSLSWGSAFAQSDQSSAVQQPASTTDTRQANPTRPKLKKNKTDTLTPKNRNQRRLAPDSLRRGGATRVDTVR
ncbi:hypothetical protein [Spirosoma foliorum]|uniref:Uncharacterized protein n=1 Tax=Spirosoma foliorum TaxID=2710596 RepID=A0A7G5GX74_9BACT|nr:hypothetical protein [Spirosoma foliorum]QMW03466.1 hypothetical protein H3H32_00395 [Spirosoma foliorum]